MYILHTCSHFRLKPSISAKASNKSVIIAAFIFWRHGVFFSTFSPHVSNVFFIPLYHFRPRVHECRISVARELFHIRKCRIHKRSRYLFYVLYIIFILRHTRVCLCALRVRRNMKSTYCGLCFGWEFFVRD